MLGRLSAKYKNSWGHKSSWVCDHRRGLTANYASERKEEDAPSARQEGLTGCGVVDQTSMILGCHHDLIVVTCMRCQGRQKEGKGSSRIVKSAFLLFLSAVPSLRGFATRHGAVSGRATSRARDAQRPHGPQNKKVEKMRKNMAVSPPAQPSLR